MGLENKLKELGFDCYNLPDDKYKRYFKTIKENDLIVNKWDDAINFECSIQSLTGYEEIILNKNCTLEWIINLIKLLESE